VPLTNSAARSEKPCSLSRKGSSPPYRPILSIRNQWMPIAELKKKAVSTTQCRFMLNQHFFIVISEKKRIFAKK